MSSFSRQNIPNYHTENRKYCACTGSDFRAGNDKNYSISDINTGCLKAAHETAVLPVEYKKKMKSISM